MRDLILFGILTILLFGCINPYQPEQNTTPSVITSLDNTSNIQLVLPENYAVQAGDHVWVDYTLWVDGEVLDTSNATLANESGIYNPGRNYKPIDFDATLNSGMIKGFVLNILGMVVNETLTFQVAPKYGYGPHDQNKMIIVPRYYEQPLYETVPLAYFESIGMNVTNGTSVSSDPLVFVSDINDENVTLFYLLMAGQQFSQNGLPRKVINVSNVSANIEILLQTNKTYSIPHPETGVTTQFLVTDITDSNITLDSNHYLANKTLTFKVTVIKIQHGDLVSE
ncbi:MAG: FKBP-type peptidyl-prolyl cis-trans isomerase [Candidatus Micrarchaeota archaeon]